VAGIFGLALAGLVHRLAPDVVVVRRRLSFVFGVSPFIAKVGTALV
jgi:hypothetical protein